MTDLEKSVEDLLSTTPFAGKKFSLVKLAGEASYREYFRIQFGENKNLILMKLPIGAASVAEEITKTSGNIQELSFINVQKYLKSIKLPVPEITGYNPATGLMALEDLGDRSLERMVKESSSEFFSFFYEQALRLLVDIQCKTQAHSDSGCVAFHRNFDLDLLFWEFNHFLEYGIEDRFQLKMDEADKAEFNALGQKLCGEIARMPQGFVHRDFQSRNLIFFDYSLWMIDFQDALLGPKLYDLVALLRDSYIDFSPSQLADLLKTFGKMLPESHPYHNKQEKLERDFHLITIQRKLKDTGRFQYIKTVKGNSNFLVHVPNSLQSVKEALGHLKEYKKLDEIISKYVPEFRA